MKRGGGRIEYIAVADHAVIRYAERCLGWDMERIRAEAMRANGCAGSDSDVLDQLAAYGLDIAQTKRILADGAAVKRMTRDSRRDVFINWRGVVLVLRDATLVTVLESSMPTRTTADKARRIRRAKSEKLRRFRGFHARLGAGG
ncbi:MAG TPA: hypothetical protein PK225_15510 [Azonexus sp.]|nr:hypothetical protein [Azonexus sp.]